MEDMFQKLSWSLNRSLLTVFDVIVIIIIIIINDIFRAQNSQVQQMHQVSRCMITFILEPRTGTFSVVS